MAEEICISHRLEKQNEWKNERKKNRIFSVKNEIENISKSLFYSILKIDNFLKSMDTSTNFCSIPPVVLSSLKILGSCINKYWY